MMSAWDVQRREQLNQEFEQIFREHERLKTDLNSSENEHRDYQNLRQSIDEWEEKSSKKLRQTARQAREDLEILFNQNRHFLRRRLEQTVTDELRENLTEKHRELNEKDLDRWLSQIAEIRTKFERFSSNIDFDDRKSLKIRSIRPIPSFDVPQLEFSTIRGRVQFDSEHRLFTASRPSAVISRSTFSSGSHFFRFRVERSQSNIFFGVIAVEDEENFRQSSRPCRSVFGWWNVDRRVLADRADSHVSALNIYTNDEIILTLNCQAKQITLEYPSMNKLNRIEIDSTTKKWKILIEFGQKNLTMIRLIDSGRQAHGNHRHDQSVHCYCSAETPST